MKIATNHLNSNKQRSAPLFLLVSAIGLLSTTSALAASISNGKYAIARYDNPVNRYTGYMVAPPAPIGGGQNVSYFMCLISSGNYMMPQACGELTLDGSTISAAWYLTPIVQNTTESRTTPPIAVNPGDTLSVNLSYSGGIYSASVNDVTSNRSAALAVNLGTYPPNRVNNYVTVSNVPTCLYLPTNPVVFSGLALDTSIPNWTINSPVNGCNLGVTVINPSTLQFSIHP